MDALARYAITIYQGADLAEVITYLAGSPPVAVNMTGFGARLMIRALPTDVTPLVSISATPNAQGSISIQPGGVIGQLVINVNRATTATLAAGRYLYDLFIDTPSGTSIVLLSGTVQVVASITH